MWRSKRGPCPLLPNMPYLFCTETKFLTRYMWYTFLKQNRDRLQEKAFSDFPGRYSFKRFIRSYKIRKWMNYVYHPNLHMRIAPFPLVGIRILQISPPTNPRRSNQIHCLLLISCNATTKSELPIYNCISHSYTYCVHTNTPDVDYMLYHVRIICM